MLVTRNRSFAKSLALRRARVLVGNGLIVSEGEFWLRQRRLMQPAFHRERMAERAVPGGVGPLTIAMLMVNTVKAAKMRRGAEVPALSRA